MPAKKLPAKKVAAPIKKAAPVAGPAKKAAGPAKKVAAAQKAAAPRRQVAMPSNIVPLDDGTGRNPKFMIYGPPGTGKTSLACTAPNSLLLEADRGEKAAVFRGSTAKKWVIKDWDDMYEALRWLQGGGDQMFDYAILDTISIFQNRGMDQIMDDLVAVRAHRQVWAPDKGEYGQNMNRLMRWIREFAELDCGIIVVAHLATEMDHEGETHYMPQVQGKNMPEKVCAYFDVVGHMSMKVKDGKEIPRFSTKNEGKYYAKDRYNGRIGALLDPSIPKIIRRIESPRAEASTDN